MKGIWSRKENTVAELTKRAACGYSVFSSSFHFYQTWNGRGGFSSVFADSLDGRDEYANNVQKCLL